jgi:hypothetical protein
MQDPSLNIVFSKHFFLDFYCAKFADNYNFIVETLLFVIICCP